MSTHPNDASRLQELQAFLPEARKYYVPAQEAQSPPPAGTPPHPPPAAPVAGQWMPAPRSHASDRVFARAMATSLASTVMIQGSAFLS